MCGYLVTLAIIVREKGMFPVIFTFSIKLPCVKFQVKCYSSTPFTSERTTSEGVFISGYRPTDEDQASFNLAHVF